MTKHELKTQLHATIDALFDASDVQSEELTPIEYFQRHFLTIGEAIIYADAQGLKLRNQPIHQFHNLCKSGKIESISIGEKNTRLIVKDSLDIWILQQKDKQGQA